VKIMKTLLLASVFAASALTATVASAQDWYVRGDVGGTFSSDLDGAATRDLDEGLALSLGAGYQLNDNIRLEGELAHLQGDVSGPLGGDVKVLGGFANAYYDFNPNGQFQPFVGAGIGLARVDVDSGAIDDDDTGFAYQFKAGVAHPFNERLTGEVAYRYVGVTDITAGAGPSRVDGDYTTSAVTVGLRYKLGQ
jgi:opacity protein-like surface antigen